MAVTDVTIPRGNPVSPWTVTGHTVYVRQRWEDDWTEVYDLFCEEAVWSAAPTIPTATLVWHYGRIARTGAVSFQEVVKLSLNRYYVKVAYGVRDWYGVVEVDEDALDGESPADIEGNRTATGMQRITAYGMEHLLDQQQVTTSYVDKDDEGDIQLIQRAITFNRENKPNRSPLEAGEIFHFGMTRATMQYWTSYDVALYLLHYFSPRDDAGEAKIPYEIELGAIVAVLPDWDHPELPAENRSVYSLLCSLMPRQRLVSFYVTVEDGEGEDDPQVVKIKPFTFTDVDVESTGDTIDAVPANQNQKRILCSEDPTGEVAVKLSTLERADQVIFRGARRRSVFTISDADETVVAGWTTEQEEEYETGASEGTGYDTADLDTQRRRNSEVRANPRLRNVFSRFALPDDWDGTVKDGLGAGDLKTVFPDDDDPPGEVLQYQPDLFIERTLPLLEGLDYSGDAIEMEEIDERDATLSEMAPMCFWLEPGTQRYSEVSRRAKDTPLTDVDAEEWRWSASVSAPDEDRAIRLNVSGAEQHVLDHPGFAPLAGVDEELGEHDWRDALFTVSVQDDRYAEGRWPRDEDVSVVGDYVQRLYVDTGEKYRCDYVVPETVVDVNEDGELVRSDGGYLHDDRPRLEAIAKVSYAYYSRERRVLQLATDQLTSELELGDFVTEINALDADELGGANRAVNTPITQLRITCAMGSSDSPPPAPRMYLVTDSGQLDGLLTVSPEPRPVADAFSWATAVYGRPSTPPAPLSSPSTFRGR